MAPRVVILVAVVASLALPAGASAVPVPAMTPPVTVVPSPGLPPDVQVDHSNANLAVAYYRGRVFMVFRTAKWQIADDNARLYVVSSVDQVHWRFEGKFAYGRDLREPRLFVWKKKLFLYFALLGSNAAAFEPGGEMATRWIAPGKWVKPRRILPQPDFIAWAVKTHRGNAYVIARRQPNFGGNYDHGLPKTPDTDPEFALYDGTYAATTKRCSLWSIDTKTREFTPLFDVPGVGDTCYPEMIRQPHGRFLVYNYTSPLDGSDPPWGTALTVGDTLIYRMTLQFL